MIVCACVPKFWLVLDGARFFSRCHFPFVIVSVACIVKAQSKCQPASQTDGENDYRAESTQKRPKTDFVIRNVAPFKMRRILANVNESVMWKGLLNLRACVCVCEKARKQQSCGMLQCGTTIFSIHVHLASQPSPLYLHRFGKSISHLQQIKIHAGKLLRLTRAQSWAESEHSERGAYVGV